VPIPWAVSRRAFPLFSLGLLLGCGSDGDASRFALTLDPALTPLMGFLDVRGEIKLPAPMPRGKTATLGVTRGRPTTFAVSDVMVTGNAPLETSAIEFTLRSLAPGPYTIFLGVDLDGDGAFGPGDMAGYYDGSPAAPLQDPSVARILDLKNHREQIDFGIGSLR
jgi:hypothetical protein